MFDTVTAASPWEVPAARRTRLIGGALVIHSALFAAYLVATLWTIAPVSPPDLLEPFRFEPAPPIASFVQPAKPPARDSSRTGRSPDPVAAAPEPATAVITQPPAVAVLIDAEPGGATVPAVDGGGGAHVLSGDATAGGTAGVDSGSVPYSIDMTPPRTLLRIEPHYPEMARRAKRQGVVVLEAEIGRDGILRSARAVNPPLGFGLEEAALEALRRWKFAPAELDGRPIAVFYRLSVNFRLH